MKREQKHNQTQRKEVIRELRLLRRFDQTMVESRNFTRKNLEVTGYRLSYL